MASENTEGAVNLEGCLFCRRHDGGFASVEHIFSEGFGNETEVLPRGVVCDRCNNGPLARADRELADFPPIQLLRAEKGLDTRSKQAVVSRWKGVDIGFTAPREMAIFGDGPSPVESLGGDRHRMSLVTTSPYKRKRGLLFMRALWKIALEYVYIDHGPGQAFDQTLDPARLEVIGAGQGSGWLVSAKNHEHLHDQIRATYSPVYSEGLWAGLPTIIDIFGIQFLTDPLRRIPPDFPQELAAEANVWVFPNGSGRVDRT